MPAASAVQQTNLPKLQLVFLNTGPLSCAHLFVVARFWWRSQFHRQATY